MLSLLSPPGERSLVAKIVLTLACTAFDHDTMLCILRSPNFGRPKCVRMTPLLLCRVSWGRLVAGRTIGTRAQPTQEDAHSCMTVCDHQLLTITVVWQAAAVESRGRPLMGRAAPCQQPHNDVVAQRSTIRDWPGFARAMRRPRNANVFNHDELVTHGGA